MMFEIRQILTDRQTDEITLFFFQFNNVNQKAHFMRDYAA